MGKSTIEPFSNSLNKKLDQILKEHGGNKREVARTLGLPRGSMYGWLRTRSAGRQATVRIELACEKYFAGSPREVQEASPTIGLPGAVLGNSLKALTRLEAKIDVLLRTCGIDPSSFGKDS